MTEIEALKAKYPEMYFQDDQLWLPNQDDKPFVGEEETKSLIQEHYEGRSIPVPHYTNNPELEEREEVSGLEYLQLNFSNGFGNIDYDTAYNSIN